MVRVELIVSIQEPELRIKNLGVKSLKNFILLCSKSLIP